MIQVKEYELGDSVSEELTQKFNESFADHMGYVPRSPTVWSDLYRCSMEVHLLVAETERALGYVIVTLQHYYGCRVAAVSEFCVWERREEVLSVLLEQVELCARKMNAEAVITWDTSDGMVNDAFGERGYISLGRSVLSAGPVSMDFVVAILESAVGRLNVESFSEEISVIIDLGRTKVPSYSGIFTLKVGPKGKVQVKEEMCSDAYARVETDIVTFTELILGNSDPYRALLSGNLKIAPFTKTMTVMKLLKSLSKRWKWHTPMGDYF